ncbi:MAG: hypothetical protein HY303_15695 [Candidatus Wallbacteria bacterium]|nr:hypothetical protein [Candidatus Wallbacteria bacterium]
MRNRSLRLFFVLVALAVSSGLLGWADDIQNHPGDVFLRLDDNSGGSRIYRFDNPGAPAFLDNQGVVWSPSSQTEGLSVDKFEHILTVQAAMWGTWAAPNPPIGNNDVLVFPPGGGAPSVRHLPGSGGFLTAVAGEFYVPPPETVDPSNGQPLRVLHRAGTSTVGAGCGSTFYNRPRVSNIFTAGGVEDTIDGPDTTGVVVGMNHWFMSSLQSQTSHGQTGNTAVRHVNAQMREEHRQIIGWADSGDASLFSIPANESPVGQPIRTGVETKTDKDLFASCGDRCKVGADHITGSPQHLGVPTKFMFSSDGVNPQAQKMYTIQGVGNTAVVQKIHTDASNVWQYDAVNASDIFDAGAGGTVQTFGNAANLAELTPGSTADDYIYTSDAKPTFFAVATRFWRNGGTHFTFNDTTGIVHWVEDYPGHSSFNASGDIKVWDKTGDPTHPVISIAADGRGNLYFLQEALDPPMRTTGAAGISGTPDFSSIDPNNPGASRYFVSTLDEPPAVPDVGSKWSRTITVHQFPIYRLRSYNYIETAHRASSADATASGFLERGTLQKGFFTYTVLALAPMSLPTTGSFTDSAAPQGTNLSVTVTGGPISSGATSIAVGSVTISGNRVYSSNNTKVTTTATLSTNVSASVQVSLQTTVPGTVTAVVNATGHFTVVSNKFFPPRTYTFNVPMSGSASLSNGTPSAVVNMTASPVQNDTQELPIAVGAPGTYSFVTPLVATADLTSVRVDQFRVDIASINVTEPPALPTADSLVDLDTSSLGTGSKDIAEDSSPIFAIENPPQFSGQFTTDQFGQANVNYSAPGHLKADTDGDGRVGYFAYSAIQRTFKWRWSVQAISYPLSMSYNDGSAAAFGPTNDGVCFKGAWNKASDYSSTQPLPMRFNDPTAPLAIQSDKFPFKDPGRYRVKIEIEGTRWTVPSNLTVFSTPSDIAESSLNPAGGNLVYSEDFDVKSIPKRTKDYPVYDVAVYGPDSVAEDTVPPKSNAPYPTASTIQNWYAQAYVQWYGATDYAYDAAIGAVIASTPDWGHVQAGGGASANRMYKWDGVGSFDYRNRSVADIQTQEHMEGLVLHQDGHSNFGTRVDRLTRDDWNLIGYTWYLKVRNPRFGAPGETEFLPKDPAKPFGEPIVTGTLAELYDLDVKPVDVKTALTDGTISSLLAVNPLPTNGQTSAENQRLFKVTLPLMNATAFSKLAFAVPTDPTRLRLTVRFSHPKVKWNPDADPTLSYFRLGSDGPGFGKYRYGLSAPAVDQPLLGVSDATDTCPTDDYVETLIQDNHLPWASGSGYQASQMFDPTNYDATRQTHYTSATLPNLPAQDIITTGGVVRYNSAAHTTIVTIVDNNPYQHFNDGTARGMTPQWPKMSQFHFEVGDDPRTRDTTWGGVGLRTVNKSYGFDIGRTDYSNANASFLLKATDFGGTDITDTVGPILDPTGNARPSPSADYIYNAFSTWGPFGYGVHLNTDSDHLPAFDDSGSFSTISKDINHWVIKDFSAQRYDTENYRVTAWKIDDVKLPAPIFLKESSAGIQTMNFGAEAQDRAPSVSPTAAAHASLPTTVGNYTVVDQDPPNLWIEVVDFKTATPIYFAIDRDWARDFSTPGMPMTSSYMSFKASVDRRPVYRDKVASEKRSDPWPSTVTRMTDSSKIDLANKTGLGGYGPPSLNVRLEEDVRFRLTVKAADNACAPKEIFLSIKGVEGTAQQHFPETKKDAGEVGINAGSVAELQATHFYPNAGESDTIHITAKDQRGNTREVALHIDVTAHETNYRVIGNVNKQVR